MKSWKLHLYTWLAILVVLALGFLVFQWNVTHFHLGHWLQIHTGTINESGPYYGFWSGFGSDLGEYVIATSILGSLYRAMRKGNCHTEGCWRMAKLPVGDPPYRVCKKCHYEATGTKVTMEHLKHHHQLHLARLKKSEDPDG